MNAALRHKATVAEGETPLRPVEVLAFSWATAHGRLAMTADDMADAALLLVDLRAVQPVALDVAAGVGEPSLTAEYVLAQFIAAGRGKDVPEPRDVAMVAKLLSALRNFGYGVYPAVKAKA